MFIQLLKVSMISVLLSGVSFANFNDEVTSYKHYEKGLIESQSQSVSAIKTSASVMNYHQFDQLINQGRNEVNQLAHQRSNQSIKQANGAILFVSFSMPKNLLVEMIDQANAYNIPVIIRGLVDNKVPKTLQAILDVKSKALKEHKHFSGIGIDPVWFEQFAITAVPALVVTQRPANCINQKICPNQPFDVVYGNQSIKTSLEAIAFKGSSIPSAIAKKILGDHHA